MSKDKLTTGGEAAALFNVSGSRIRQIAIAAGFERKGRDWIFDSEQLKVIEAGTRAGQEKAKKSRKKKEGR
jgi:hypothetical protein